jgi:uncharacterized protein
MQASNALLQALLIILFVGGLSLLAQWGRKNRGAEIGLIVILLFFSFLVLTLGATIALVGLSGAAPTLGLPPELSASAAAVSTIAGLAGLTLCVPPLRKVAGRRDTAERGTAPDSEGLSSMGWSSEGRVFDLRGSDPPTFFGLWMFVIVLVSNVVGLLIFALKPDVVDSAFTAAGRISLFTIFVSQVPFVVLALLGLGLGVRRNLRQTLSRLGYGPLTLRQLGIVAVFIAGAFLLSLVADTIFAALQPDLYERVGKISDGLFDPGNLSTVSAILFALSVGIGAGLGEETLFRGAVQPALGITLTSILFASMHIQYGPSLLLGYIFVLSVGLGFLRRHLNTTATFLAHAGYNSLGVLLTYLLGI